MSTSNSKQKQRRSGGGVAVVPKTSPLSKQDDIIKHVQHLQKEIDDLQKVLTDSSQIDASTRKVATTLPEIDEENGSVNGAAPASSIGGCTRRRADVIDFDEDGDDSDGNTKVHFMDERDERLHMRSEMHNVVEHFYRGRNSKELRLLHLTLQHLRILRRDDLFQAIQLLTAHVADSQARRIAPSSSKADDDDSAEQPDEAEEGDDDDTIPRDDDDVISRPPVGASVSNMGNGISLTSECKIVRHPVPEGERSNGFVREVDAMFDLLESILRDISPVLAELVPEDTDTEDDDDHDVPLERQRLNSMVKTLAGAIVDRLPRDMSNGCDRSVLVNETYASLRTVMLRKYGETGFGNSRGMTYTKVMTDVMEYLFERLVNEGHIAQYKHESEHDDDSSTPSDTRLQQKLNKLEADVRYGWWW